MTGWHPKTHRRYAEDLSDVGRGARRQRRVERRVVGRQHQSHLRAVALERGGQRAAYVGEAARLRERMDLGGCE